MLRPYPAKTQWTFSGRSRNFENTAPLTLYWEAEGDAMSDDFTPDEIDAAQLFARWCRWLEAGSHFDKRLGNGWVRIFWTVRGPGVSEFAPFDPMNPHTEDFLTFFTWPISSDGVRLNWLRLPVENKLWNRRSWTKGGFIQEATGWKPGPYQSHLYLPALRQGAET